MKSNMLTLAIIIPVYNEERYLKACLDSIAAQTLKPDEVIVVDNNSTDDSMAIAGSYSFVKILHERRQHQVFAQAAGFDAASADILGRVDADCILPPDWVSKVINYFEENKEVIALTGGTTPYDVDFEWIGIALFQIYINLASLIAGHRLLFGSNCAIRKSGWAKVRSKVLMRPDIWEDYDMTFCLAKYGQIKYLTGNAVGSSFRALHTSFLQHARYQFRSVRTFYFRSRFYRLVPYIVLWAVALLFYPAVAVDDWLLQRRELKEAR